MTTIDTKRAREVAERLMDYAQVSNDTINVEAAFLLRSLCEIVEKRDLLREAGQVTAMACLELANTEGLSIRQQQIIQEISDQTRSALAVAGKEKAPTPPTMPR